MRQGRKGLAAIAVLLVLFVVAGIGIVIGHSDSYLPQNKVIGWALTSTLFGMLVGLSEILSRYRDEPLLASATGAGIAYLFLNGVLALAAFMVLQMYPGKIFPDLAKDLFLTSIVAGFGAMVVFRSKLFTFRSPDGKDYSIGPAIVLETALRTIDSKIDRRRATERQIEVFQAMHDLTDFSSTASYIEASLLSFQNLSQDDKAAIANVIQEYRDTSKWPDSLKVLGLGFAFLNLACDTNFDQVITNLKAYLKAQAASLSVPPANPPAPVNGPPNPSVLR
jgi:ABC-type transport system involved in multi-copper enzyme maturation permease subunit